MDLPASDLGPVKEGVPLFHCDHADTELLHKIAQLLPLGVAAACVDNNTSPFKGSASVVVDIRNEMVDYLTKRSEAHVAKIIVQGNVNLDQAEDDPTKIISIFIDDFASLKRNWVCCVSRWLLCKSRADKIADFVQEMEKDGFWLIHTREVIAQALLKNVNFNNTSQCAMKFDTARELADHISQCNFRPVNCEKEGCNATFSALHMEKHDTVCSYKLLPCELNCSESIMRSLMDRHCKTLCPMRLVKCSFDRDGCESTCTARELADHKAQCNFRPVNCTIQGCTALFLAVNADNHDSLCLYKVLPCEQGCSESMIRGEMGRHCNTVCPMKLVKCPFYQVGCQSTLLQRSLEAHCSNHLGSHLLLLLQAHQIDKASVDELERRVQSLEMEAFGEKATMDELKRRVKFLEKASHQEVASMDELEHRMQLLEMERWTQ